MRDIMTNRSVGRIQVRLRSAPMLVALLACVSASCSGAEPREISLDSTANVTLLNVNATPTDFGDRKGLSVTEGEVGDADAPRLVVLKDAALRDGVIELELSGDVAAGAIEGARGFVGVAFRCAADASRFECIYLRPTNGRADEQVRRNHSVQYICHPDFPWHMLRRDFPGKYETYVDLVPGEWTKVKIDVRGETARLFVHGAEQPTLLVNDLKQGHSEGAIALMIGPGTIARFANLRVTAD
jgi:hypothetical protein